MSHWWGGNPHSPEPLGHFPEDEQPEPDVCIAGNPAADGRCGQSNCVCARQPKFVAVGKLVMQGKERVAEAASHTKARRIANALNIYQPTRKGY